MSLTVGALCERASGAAVSGLVSAVSARPPLGGFPELPQLAFSERGCQEKHFPADRPPGRNTAHGSQPLLGRDDLLIRLEKFSTLHDTVVLSLETEKQTAA